MILFRYAYELYNVYRGEMYHASNKYDKNDYRDFYELIVGKGKARILKLLKLNSYYDVA